MQVEGFITPTEAPPKPAASEVISLNTTLDQYTILSKIGATRTALRQVPVSVE